MSLRVLRSIRFVQRVAIGAACVALGCCLSGVVVMAMAFVMRRVLGARSSSCLRLRRGRWPRRLLSRAASSVRRASRSSPSPTWSRGASAWRRAFRARGIQVRVSAIRLGRLTGGAWSSLPARSVLAPAVMTVAMSGSTARGSSRPTEACCGVWRGRDTCQPSRGPASSRPGRRMHVRSSPVGA